MAWIPIDQSLRDHRKVLLLASELGVERVAAIGHLVLFWLWCMDNAPSGILKRINGLQIATAAAWSGNPNDLVSALLSSGFLEKCGRGGISLRIHDWGQYGGRLCVARVANKERMKRTRASLEKSRSDQNREEESTKDSSSKRPWRKKNPFDKMRRTSGEGEPLSGKHHDKVQH